MTTFERYTRFLFEYETARVVTFRHVPLGLLKMCMQIGVVAFILVYDFGYSKGYQAFAPVQSSVTTKVN